MEQVWLSANRAQVAPELPLVGMSGERARLDRAFEKGESILVLGPAGSGKTRLLQDAAAAHPGVLYLAWQTTLHDLLASIARALIVTGHAEFLGRARPGGDIETWIAAQTSLHLKGLLWNAIVAAPVPMILDGVVGATFPAYRFLQRIYHTPGMALFAASRDTIRMGTLARLFWNPSGMVNVPPLNNSEAAQLFDAAAGHFQLGPLDLDAFRENVLEAARGNPGQIIEMCRMATDPQYLSGRHVKFAPLRIDAMIRFAE